MKRISVFLICISIALAPLLAWALPFAPASAATATLTCNGTTSRTALAVAVGSQGQIELQNVGTVTVFVEAGDSTVTAAVASGYPVPTGQSKLITVGASVTHVACITAGTSVTLYATVGKGDS